MVGAYLIWKNREQTKRVLGVGLGAGMIGVLALVPHLDRLNGVGHRFGTLVRDSEPLWAVNPWQSVDVVSLFSPGRVDLGDALVRTHPGYLGFGVLLLVLRTRQHVMWFVCALFVVFSFGPEFWFAGTPSGVQNPVWFLFQWLPGAGLLNHLGRVLGIVMVALSVLAALGGKTVQIRVQMGVGHWA